MLAAMHPTADINNTNPSSFAATWLCLLCSNNSVTRITLTECAKEERPVIQFLWSEGVKTEKFTEE